LYSKGLGTVKFTQPILVHKHTEEYKPVEVPASKTPAVARQVLMKGGGDGAVVGAQAKIYMLPIATCMYMMQWSCPDICNAVHRQTRHMTVSRETHVQNLMMLIRYVVSTENRGLVLLPKEWWSPEYKFKIHGQSDSDYVMNPDDRRNISDGMTKTKNLLTCTNSQSFHLEPPKGLLHFVQHKGSTKT
jgi:hypothetical protein